MRTMRRKLSQAELELEAFLGVAPARLPEPEPQPEPEPEKGRAPVPEPLAEAPEPKIAPVPAPEALASEPEGEPPLPRSWSNGSAVFRTKAKGGGWPDITPTEERDGFLGRMESRGNGRGYHIWRWKDGAYAYAGRSSDIMSALAKL